jgi:hypothetical protein
MARQIMLKAVPIALLYATDGLINREELIRYGKPR